MQKHSAEKIISLFTHGDFAVLNDIDFNPNENASDEDEHRILGYIYDRIKGVPESADSQIKSKVSFDRKRLGIVNSPVSDKQTEELRSLADPVNRDDGSRYSRPERKEHIGWAVLDQPMHYHKADYETASWYTDYEIKAGAYPVYLHTRLKSLFYYVDDALVLDEHFPALFGGVSIGSQLNKPNVGRLTRIIRSLPDLYAMPIYREGVYVASGVRFVLLDGVEMHSRFSILGGHSRIAATSSTKTATTSVINQKVKEEKRVHLSNKIVLETGETL